MRPFENCTCPDRGPSDCVNLSHRLDVPPPPKASDLVWCWAPGHTSVTTASGLVYSLGDAGGWSAGPGRGVLTWAELVLELGMTL